MRHGTPPIPIPGAIEVFVRGFTFTRSFTWPANAERIGPLWVMRDAERKDPKHYRNEEWISHGQAPAAVDRLARQHTRGRFVVCAIHASGEPDAPLRDGFKALGYRLWAIETFMAVTLNRIPTFRPPAGITITRVTDLPLANAVAKAARKQLILPTHLTKRPPIRLYAALKGGRPIGWMRSIMVKRCTWTSDVFVNSRFRRKGIGKALLSVALHDDRRCGAKTAVLLASHTGAMLYPALGYRTIGSLLLLIPRRR